MKYEYMVKDLTHLNKSIKDYLNKYKEWEYTKVIKDIAMCGGFGGSVCFTEVEEDSGSLYDLMGEFNHLITELYNTDKILFVLIIWIHNIRDIIATIMIASGRGHEENLVSKFIYELRDISSKSTKNKKDPYSMIYSSDSLVLCDEDEYHKGIRDSVTEFIQIHAVDSMGLFMYDRPENFMIPSTHSFYECTYGSTMSLLALIFDEVLNNNTSGDEKLDWLYDSVITNPTGNIYTNDDDSKYIDELIVSYLSSKEFYRVSEVTIHAFESLLNDMKETNDLTLNGYISCLYKMVTPFIKPELNMTIDDFCKTVVTIMISDSYLVMFGDIRNYGPLKNIRDSILDVRRIESDETFKEKCEQMSVAVLLDHLICAIISRMVGRIVNSEVLISIKSHSLIGSYVMCERFNSLVQ